MKKINKNFIKISLSVVFAAIFIFSFFYILRIIKIKGDNANRLGNEVQAEADRRSKIASLNSEIKAIAPERAILETHFAKSSDVVPFLDTLQAIALEAGAPAEISSVNLNKDNGSLEVAMNAAGSFGNVHKLLALLQSSPYELDFSSVDLSRKTLSDAEAKTAGPIPEWEASFKLTLISFNP